jgi:hypothetical protein
LRYKVLSMDQEKSLRDLAAIRSMMEESSRFMSLSGLSGLSAGAVALLGAGGVYAYLRERGILGALGKRIAYIPDNQTLIELSALALLTLACALGASAYFTLRRVRQQGQPLWTPAARRLLLSLALPLAAGAAFCLQLAWWGMGKLVPGATLLFYGMALFSAAKYTLGEVRWLGLAQMALGLLAGFFTGYGLLFWAAGFGLLHMFYGLRMYWKYER